MMKYNGGWEGLALGLGLGFRVRVKKGSKNGGRKDCIAGKEGWEGWGGRKK